jgi:hypothetical protein
MIFFQSPRCLNFIIVILVTVTFFVKYSHSNDIKNSNDEIINNKTDLNLNQYNDNPILKENILDDDIQDHSDYKTNEENKSEEKKKTQDDIDYFYDQDLTQEEIEKRKKENQEAEKMKKQQEKEKTNQEQEPAWFQKAKENTDDPFADFMKKQVEEYLKNYRKEQIEKLKTKTKSDLNHQMLSIVFLSAFFAAGTLIGLIIVFLRGHGHGLLKIISTNPKNSKNTIYKQVLTNNQTENNNNINNEEQLTV